jgi:hypothetical protein
MLKRVTFVRTDVSEELSASIIRVTRISELRTTLAVNTNRNTRLFTAIVVISSLILFFLMIEPIRSSRTSVLTRATRRHTSKEGILLSFTFSEAP